MNRIRNTAAATASIVASTLASNAVAIPQELYWEPVDNSTNLAGVSTGFELSWRTFDLYLVHEEGDATAAIDFGITASNIGLSTNGVFYNGAPMSTDSVNANIAEAPLNPDLEYDSAVTINGNPISFAQAMDWDPTGVTGAWFINPLQHPTGGPNGPYDMWVARITVNADATALGGELFPAGIGPHGGAYCKNIADIPNCIIEIPTINPSTYVPAPGAILTLAMLGVTASRRQR